jgi:tetratricopeptide (TPR) repeat protein
MPVRILVQGIALAALSAGAALAQVAPTRDTVVETQLLPRAVKASVRQLAAGAPSASRDRFADVRRLIEAGRASGDPRTLGYAESLLVSWSADDPNPPTEALVLRATIEQSRHRFDAARTLLDRAIARAPGHGQALLTRATIAQVRGDHAAALSDCLRLRPLNADVAAVCAALTDAATGHNERAIGTLTIAVDRTQGAVRAWALGALAQVHEQRGAHSEAVAAYRASLAAGDDLTTRVALADLRRWQIARATGGGAAELEAQLQARFAEASARGELLHAREAAVFALERGEFAAALRLARENWQAQREAADLVVLARAARAARDAAGLDEVRQWLRRTRLDDVRLRRALGGAET